MLPNYYNNITQLLLKHPEIRKLLVLFVLTICLFRATGDDICTKIRDTTNVTNYVSNSLCETLKEMFIYL